MLQAHSRHLAPAAALALLLAALVPAAALARSPGDLLLTTKSPYWKVGKLDLALSRACSIGQFGPQANRYFGRFTGKQGAGILLAARGDGVNLYDPGRLRQIKFDYWFHNPFTTSCEVYATPSKRGP
jgi:hypothetical protein